MLLTLNPTGTAGGVPAVVTALVGADGDPVPNWLTVEILNKYATPASSPNTERSTSFGDSALSICSKLLIVD
jgi:hypothetical protein